MESKQPVSNNTFSAAITLAEGVNTITATATDTLNQTATVHIQVTVVTKGSLAGTVTDSQTGLALPGVTVRATDAGGAVHQTMTNELGFYAFSDVPAGSITTRFSKSGYIGQYKQAVITAGSSTTVNLQLAVAPALTITIVQPDDGDTVTSPFVTLMGTASNDADVAINGQQVASMATIFLCDLVLHAGVNILTITATDTYGQTVTIYFTINYIIPQTQVYLSRV